MSNFSVITCVTSSLCFPWFSDNDQILSNKVDRIILYFFFLLKNFHHQKLNANICKQAVQAQKEPSCPSASVVVTLRDCIPLFLSFFTQNICMVPSLAQEKEVGTRGSPAAKQRRVYFWAGLTSHIILLLSIVYMVQNILIHFK